MYRHLLRHLTSFTIKTPTTPIQLILHITTNHYPFPKITQLAPDFKDFTFVCPTELVDFNERLDEFRQVNTQVIGCSTDSVHSHLEITRRYDILIDNNDGVALLGLFIIDKQQILRQITINDLPVGRSVDETLRLIKAFQYVEQHGKVCPADLNEKTNPNTIKPESKEYFLVDFNFSVGFVSRYLFYIYMCS